MKRQAVAFVSSVVLFVASGANCPNMRQQLTPQPPPAFTGPPTLPDVLRVVNTNTQRIQRLQTDSVSLTIQGLPSLRANLALQRPRSLRLRAQFIGLGQVLDLGSNDERFWALVDAPQLASNVPRAVYTARHDQFLQSQARAMLPVQPDWLIDVFGLLELDPAGAHEGPYAHGPGRLQIRSKIQAPDGPLTRVAVLDERFGWVLEQHLYNAQGQLLGSAIANNYRYYPETGASLPHRVTISLPPPNRSIQLDVQAYIINQLYSDPAQLFAMPTYAGFPVVDLSNPQAGSPTTAVGPTNPGPNPGAGAGQTLPPPPVSPWTAPGAGQPGATPPAGYPSTGSLPRYRGYTSNR